ncbi:DUF58 domain-containing protein [Pimelobacter simplex]|uniref:DUF58 domain-containing protein n=1 Tax=Nocardioides simplex TaxID=2045 RepID=A0A4Y3N0K0_NOCSI|nr:DUF58 domain-containing protein [Pimelobacter simplex]KAB2808950.1 DUF58 domain-containing protein [Pimelobacter simplex]MCG8152187.1 DUF58 domain-containing protein [Pimelobacter simplex]GEB12931.1 hypothetical protein NSI01_12460 [Pimelobacter simplex]SFM52066.1 Uncharacterized conserved protein, DUF58 family, contains vWF domain [Pimelobacter simplex]
MSPRSWVAGARRALTAVSRRRAALGGALRDGVAERTRRLRTAVAPVTDTVTPAGWVVGLLAVVLVVAGPLLHWRELVVAGIFLVLVLLIAVGFVVGRSPLAARLDLARDRVIVGERANGYLTLTNPSQRRSRPLVVEFPVGAGRAAFELPGLAPGALHEELFAVPTAHRAVLDVGPVTAVRADPLGLLRRVRHLSEMDRLYVHPKTLRVDGSAAGLIRDLEGRTVPKVSDNDVSFHALRGYVAGDDRRHIHWKSSAKTGSLMVRQFEETRRSHLLTVVSSRLEDYASDDEFELAISVAGSLGTQALADGQQLSAAASHGSLPAAGAQRFLDGLSGLTYDWKARRLVDVARHLGSDELAASVIVLCIGSGVSITDLRRARQYLPVDTRAIAVRCLVGDEPSVRWLGDLAVATVGRLDELAVAVRRVAA